MSVYYNIGTCCLFFRPNGQIELSLVVPESDDTVVIGAFILHPESGLAIVSEIAQVGAQRKSTHIQPLNRCNICV